MLRDDLVIDFANNFFGYGNLTAPLWFVGMEEAGGNTIYEVVNRLSAWDKRGRQITEDLVDYHRSIGITKHFQSSNATIQHTWGKLIRSTLVGFSQNVSKETIQNYQATHWGRMNGNNCLLELLPLPARSSSDWNYSAYSSLPMLSSRKNYKSWLIKSRSTRLRELIERNRPKIVVFYGLVYEEFWFNIVGDQNSWTSSAFGKHTCIKNTFFVSSPHPAARGMKLETFDKLGSFIKFALKQENL